MKLLTLVLSLFFGAMELSAATCEQTLDQIKAGNLRMTLQFLLENQSVPSHAEIMQLSFRLLVDPTMGELKCAPKWECGNKPAINFGVWLEEGLSRVDTAGHWVVVCPAENLDPADFQGTFFYIEYLTVPHDFLGVMASDLGVYNFESLQTHMFVHPFPEIDHYPDDRYVRYEWGTGNQFSEVDRFLVSIKRYWIGIESKPLP